MSFKTTAQFISQWIDNFIPFAIHYEDVWDSHEKRTRIVTLNASGETSMRVKFQGDNVPTLTKLGNGSYQLALGAKTGNVSFVWKEAGGTLTGSNSLQLSVINADFDLLYCPIRVFSSTTGGEFNSLSGVNLSVSDTTGTKTVSTLSNINNIPGDWIVTGQIL